MRWLAGLCAIGLLFLAAVVYEASVHEWKDGDRVEAFWSFLVGSVIACGAVQIALNALLNGRM